MNLRDQALMVNLGILSGLVCQCFRGAPMTALLAVGILFLALANLIFLGRQRRSKLLK